MSKTDGGKGAAASTKTKGKGDGGAAVPGKPAQAAPATPGQAELSRDWSKTLFLPKTDFPMRAGLPDLEPACSRAGARSVSTTACARRAQGQGQVRAARRAALRQRRHPHRPCAEQDPEGLRGPLALAARLRRRLRARLGLPRPADRVEDRGGVPRQGPQQGRGVQGRVPRRLPRLRRRTGSTSSARSSSAWACSATGTHRYSTMDFATEAAIVAEFHKFATNGSSTAAPSR